MTHPAVRERKEQARAAKTRAVLIDAARQSFGSRGYNATVMGDLVADASLTRGALYHHFADKADLFEAVVRQVSIEIRDKAYHIVQTNHPDISDMFLQGMNTYLRLIAYDLPAQRIILIDGPSVLGWDRWQAINSDIFLTGMVRALEMLMDLGEIRQVQAETMGRLILASLNEASHLIAHAKDREKVWREVTNAIEELIKGLARQGLSRNKQS